MLRINRVAKRSSSLTILLRKSVKRASKDSSEVLGSDFEFDDLRFFFRLFTSVFICLRENCNNNDDKEILTKMLRLMIAKNSSDELNEKCMILAIRACLARKLHLCNM